MRFMLQSGVKLVYDVSAAANWHQVAIDARFQVMTCNAPHVRKALQFACGNALVTETAEQAKTLAFGANRHRVVALDGTLFQPSGLISGGGTELKSRAKKWDEQTIRKLKEEQRALFDRIHALQATTKRELDLEIVAFRLWTKANGIFSV